MGLKPKVRNERRRKEDRNRRVYELLLLGESERTLARKFGVHHSRISAIKRQQGHRRRMAGEPWGEEWIAGMARAAREAGFCEENDERELARLAWLEGLEPVE